MELKTFHLGRRNKGNVGAIKPEGLVDCNKYLYVHKHIYIYTYATVVLSAIDLVKPYFTK